MSEFWDKASKILDAPFPLEDIEFRIGSTREGKTKGLLLAYVTNRAIQQRLDDAFGKAGWTVQFERWEKEKGNICTISVYDPEKQTWIHKSDGADDSDMEAFKGGLSNAMKRAAVQWGIGRYLYKLPKWWVDLYDHKYPARGEEDRVRSEFPEWALPEGYEKPKPPKKPVPQQSGNIDPESLPLDGKQRKWLFATLNRWLDDVEFPEEKVYRNAVIKEYIKESTGKESTKEITVKQLEMLTHAGKEHLMMIVDRYKKKWEENA
jgi:hypothetical protein